MSQIQRPSFKKNWHEQTAWAKQRLVCGIDEAGRGALAGPLVVAAAIVPVGTRYRLLKDSKILSQKDRETAYAWLTKHAWTSVALIDHWHIDTHNIYQATLYGMRQAWLKLACQYPHITGLVDRITVDAMPLVLNSNAPEIHAFCYGESYSLSIAAASIIAKVTRDRLMHQAAAFTPHHELAAHKGYATKQHRTAIKTHGASLIHRTTFIDHFHQESDRQHGIFDL